jgi:hyperosmotically inducible protein
MKLSVITAVAMLAVGPLTGAAFAQAGSATEAKQTDEQLASLITTKIANDKTLGADAVKVTVEGGVVTLSGMVAKDADKAKAASLARVPGVVRVDNKLSSREKATNKAKQGAEKTKEAVSKTGEVITDGWISTRIKTKFMGDEALRASDIKVDTNDNVVTLTGAVPDDAARAKAIAMAKDVEGVKRVVNKLAVAKN